MGSIGISAKGGSNIRITGGSCRNFEFAISAENVDGLTIESHQMFTKNGVYAKNCKNLNFNKNSHNTNINSFTDNKISDDNEFSMVMFYAYIYLKHHNYNPYI